MRTTRRCFCLRGSVLGKLERWGLESDTSPLPGNLTREHENSHFHASPGTFWTGRLAAWPGPARPRPERGQGSFPRAILGSWQVGLLWVSINLSQSLVPSLLIPFRLCRHTTLGSASQRQGLVQRRARRYLATVWLRRESLPSHRFYFLSDQDSPTWALKTTFIH